MPGFSQNGVEDPNDRISSERTFTLLTYTPEHDLFAFLIQNAHVAALLAMCDVERYLRSIVQQFHQPPVDLVDSFSSASQVGMHGD